MKRWGITLAVLMAFTVNCVFAVDVNDVNEWNNATKGVSNGNVIINLQKDLVFDNLNFNSDNMGYLTVNGNGHTITVNGNCLWNGTSLTNVYNLDLDIKGNFTFNGGNTQFISDSSSSVKVGGATSLGNATFETSGKFSSKTFSLTTGNETFRTYEGSVVVIGENKESGVYSGGEGMNISGSPTITIGGKLTVNGNVSVSNSSGFTISKSGVVIVKGDLQENGNASFTVQGDGDGGGKFRVQGDVNFNYSTLTLDGNTEMYVDGDMYFTTNESWVFGKLSVQGELNTVGTGTGVFHTNDGSTSISAGDLICESWIVDYNGGCASWLGITKTFNKLSSDDYIKSIPKVLPIVLSAFTAVSQQNYVNVCWTTESEQNNDYFTIYRSADGENFEQIGTEAGAGNSTMTLNYSFVDYYPLDGVSYYLLQQTDYDGTSKYSKKVVVKRSLSVEPCMVKVFPNPYKNDDVLTIDLGASNNANVQVQIVDAMGKVVSNVSCKTIGSAMRINPKLNAGVYMVKVSVDGQTSTQKLVVE